MFKNPSHGIRPLSFTRSCVQQLVLHLLPEWSLVLRFAISWVALHWNPVLTCVSSYLSKSLSISNASLPTNGMIDTVLGHKWFKFLLKGGLTLWAEQLKVGRLESLTCAAFESYRWARRSWRSVGLVGELERQAIESQFVPGQLKRRVWTRHLGRPNF